MHAGRHAKLHANVSITTRYVECVGIRLVGFKLAEHVVAEGLILVPETDERRANASHCCISQPSLPADVRFHAEGTHFLLL